MRSEDESSIYTVIVYLNSEFKGGTTNFLHESDVGQVLASPPVAQILNLLALASQRGV